DLGAAAPPDRGPRQSPAVRGRWRPAEGEPACHLVARGGARLPRASRAAAPSPHGEGFPLDRLPSLHDAGGRGRGRPRRPLAGHGKDRVRHPLRSRWPHPARPRRRMKDGRMTVLVTDRGFGVDDWAGREILPFETLAAGGDLPADGLAIDFPNDRDPAELAPWFGRLALVRIAFPSFTDGRGFSVATRLRG